MPISSRLFAFVFISFFLFSFVPCAHAALPIHYVLTDTLSLPGPTRWDYLTFDESHHRLFITRGDRIDILDVESKKTVGTITGLDGVHGVALAPDLNKGFITEGKNNRVTVFDLTNFKVLGTVPTGAKPDAIAYDTATHNIFAANGESGDLTVIDAASNKVISTIKLDGQPEYIAVDGKGRLYVNLEDKSKIAAIDTNILKLVSRYDLAHGCDGPTGLAIDAARNRLFSVCANKNMVIVDTGTGKIIDTLPIGQHADAASFDSETGLAFSSNGGGTLTIVGIGQDGHYHILQTVDTQPTARTMALDPTTHRIYLAAADTDGMDSPTPQHPDPRPHIKPDSFRILTVDIAHSGF